MGYYTSYGLCVCGNEDRVHEFENELLEVTRYADGQDDCEVKELVSTGGVYAKLYDIEDTISDLAPKYPDLLIILSGDGEESDDLWEARWKGSEYEKQAAEIPPFKNHNLWTDYEKTQENIKQN